jgi:hypothetical protein
MINRFQMQDPHPTPHFNTKTTKVDDFLPIYHEGHEKHEH